MSDIWHTADEYNYSAIAFPEDAIVVDTGNGEYRAYSSFYDMPHHCDDPDCCFAETSCWKRWAKLADLLALETKLERTRKALDVAVDKLKGIKAYYDDSYADPHTFVNWHIVAQRLANNADDAIKAITALEQKDK